VTDDAWGELCEKIEQRLTPMLERLRGLSMVVEIESLKADASAMLGEIVGGNRWHVRGDGTRRGPFPRDDKADNDRRREGKGGRGGKGRKGAALQVDFYNDPNDTKGGYVESNGCRVNLNSACARVKRAQDEVDSVWIAESAASLLFNSQVDKMLPGQRAQPFQDSMGDLWRSPIRVRMQTPGKKVSA
jgi:hypothetical protein